MPTRCLEVCGAQGWQTQAQTSRQERFLLVPQPCSKWHVVQAQTRQGTLQCAQMKAVDDNDDQASQQDYNKSHDSDIQQLSL